MRVGISNDGKTILKSEIVPASPDNFEVGIETLNQVTNKLATGEKIEAVGGGIAVVFNNDKSIPISTSHLHGWVNKPLKETLQNKFNCPVFLENDTAVVGLGEAAFGTDTKGKIVVYITVGTGLGGVRIVNGKVDQNALGFEPGHQIIVIDGNLCHCGGKGHLETYVGGWYLERDYKMNPREIRDPAIWDKITRYLSIGLTNSIVHWSPDIVIMGGAVMQSISLDRLKEYLKKDLTIFPNPSELAAGKLGNEGGLLGALVLIKT